MLWWGGGKAVLRWGGQSRAAVGWGQSCAAVAGGKAVLRQGGCTGRVCGAMDWTVPPPSQANLPLLQRELLHCARMAKQTPAQYLAQHEQLLLDANASSPIDSSELLLEVGESGKRRTPDRSESGGGESAHGAFFWGHIPATLLRGGGRWCPVGTDRAPLLHPGPKRTVWSETLCTPSTSASGRAP